jgi:murein DD-endopeptidase MepM/ murein hydrolase activator NlpD
VALFLLFFMGVNIVSDGLSQENVTLGDLINEVDSNPLSNPSFLGLPEPQINAMIEESPEAIDPNIFESPYKSYWLTQGIHGLSYGHYAIDIAAGKGASIFSPINGFVAERYTDEYGNPTLVLENDRFRVTMLHGKYIVEVGESVSVGTLVGSESNRGYTTDMQGRSCRNRDCGYHTHLNVFDKQFGENVNPLPLIKDD